MEPLDILSRFQEEVMALGEDGDLDLVLEEGLEEDLPGVLEEVMVDLPGRDQDIQPLYFPDMLHILDIINQ
jgi:hypothetical protein